MHKNILFDLDGTLTDSGLGIMNCAKVALTHFGLPIPNEDEMRKFVGPPLKDSFHKHGVPEDRISEAVSVYRNRYLTIGMYENFPYSGIPELLENLNRQGHKLYVATSKPEHLAVAILEHFNLAHCFAHICGAAADDSRGKKEEVIQYLLDKMETRENLVMVGDTIFDVLGAKALHIPAIGVAWGYGDVAEMKNAGATIVETPDELFNLLNTETAC